MIDRFMPPSVTKPAPSGGELLPLELAIKFHDIYERLAPSFGYETRTETRKFNPETPNGRLMIAVCGEILQFLCRAPSPDLEAISEETVQEFSSFLHGLPCGRGAFKDIILSALKLATGKKYTKRHD